MREIGISSGGMDDLVSWFCAASAFLAMAHTFRHGDFVRVTLLHREARRRARAACSRPLRSRSPRVFTGYLAWWAVRYVYESWQYKDMSQGSSWCRSGSRSSRSSIGAVLLFVAVVDQLVAGAAREQARLRRVPRGAPRARRLQRGHDDGACIEIAGTACCCRSCSLLLAGGVWIAMTLAIVGFVGLAFFTTRRRARTSSPRSGARAPRGRSRRCRCSSGWARSSSARACRARCSRPRAVAEPRARAADAREHPRLRRCSARSRAPRPPRAPRSRRWRCRSSEGAATTRRWRWDRSPPPARSAS